MFVSRSRFQRSSVVSCCCGTDRSSFVEISSNRRRPMIVRKEGMANAERRRVGWQVKYGWKSCLQKRSLSLVARSGTVVVAQKRTFGQGRRVAGFRRVFRLCCKINTCKPCRQRVAVGLNHHRQATVRTRCWLEGRKRRQSGLRRLTCENCEKKLRGSTVKDGNHRCSSKRQVKK